MLIFIACALCIMFVIEGLLLEVERWGWATLTLIGVGVSLHFLNVINAGHVYGG